MPNEVKEKEFKLERSIVRKRFPDEEWRPMDVLTFGLAGDIPLWAVGRKLKKGDTNIRRQESQIFKHKQLIVSKTLNAMVRDGMAERRGGKGKRQYRLIDRPRQLRDVADVTEAYLSRPGDTENGLTLPVILYWVKKLGKADIDKLLKKLSPCWKPDEEIFAAWEKTCTPHSPGTEIRAITDRAKQIHRCKEVLLKQKLQQLRSSGKVKIERTVLYSSKE